MFNLKIKMFIVLFIVYCYTIFLCYFKPFLEVLKIEWMLLLYNRNRFALMERLQKINYQLWRARLIEQSCTCRCQRLYLRSANELSNERNLAVRLNHMYTLSSSNANMSCNIQHLVNHVIAITIVLWILCFFPPCFSLFLIWRSFQEN